MHAHCGAQLCKSRALTDTVVLPKPRMPMGAVVCRAEEKQLEANVSTKTKVVLHDNGRHRRPS
jgi:hypothetical protein